MTDIVNEGWLWIYSGSNYLKLYVEKVKGHRHFNPTHNHYTGGGHLAYDLQKRWWTFDCMGVWETSHANYYDSMYYIETWQNAGTFSVLFVKDTSNNGMQWTKSSTVYTVQVAKDGVRNVEKVGNENVDYYRIGLLILEQVG